MTARSADDLKRAAAAAALDLVPSGARLGLGTGSTAAHFVDLLAEKSRGGFEALCVPTSEQTKRQAESLGLKLSTLDETPQLDLVVDGADEFDDALRLIKGGGGALLREKIVAAAARRMIVIADESKHVATLGAFPLPVEIDPFGALATCRHVEDAARDLKLSGTVARRMRADGSPFVTDGGHWILDCVFGALPRPEDLARRLKEIPGVVEHGLFIGLASLVIVAGEGGVKFIGAVDGAAF
ncbi:MAG TPA: ribose-5-phosphate isomerase RpiA [Methylocystis sp.]|nr:ribose-5-phosphate isomerase RpiA [Methylocystis sp.]